MDLKKRTIAWSLALLLFLQGFLLYSPIMPTSFAEGPGDPAPELLPVGAANGKTVLFDNTHEETAGSADWVIDGAFSDFGQALANTGYDIKELRKTSALTYSDIQNGQYGV